MVRRAVMQKFSVKLVGAEEAIKSLKKLDDNVRKKILKKVAREALKPMVASYKRNIRDSDEVFKVYRDGKIYAEIQPGQLRRSVGIKFPRNLNKRGRFGASVGPRRSGSFKSQNKGGWYAGFINFGWLRIGGKRYTGDNKGFAQKAMAAAKMQVTVKFRRTFTEKVNKEVKKLKFAQKQGLR